MEPPNQIDAFVVVNGVSRAVRLPTDRNGNVRLTLKDWAKLCEQLEVRRGFDAVSILSPRYLVEAAPAGLPWHGIYEPELNCVLGLPTIRPAFSNRPVSNVGGGSLLREWEHGEYSVSLIERLHCPRLVLQYVSFSTPLALFRRAENDLRAEGLRVAWDRGYTTSTGFTEILVLCA